MLLSPLSSQTLLYLGGEGVQLGEVRQLCAVGEVEEEVGEVGTPVGQLLQDLPGDQVTRQLQVAQVGGEPRLDELDQHVHVGDHQTCRTDISLSSSLPPSLPPSSHLISPA